MALIIDLKPGEKILIGTAVITNDTQRTRLHISGEAPILREKDVLQENQADTPCRKVYFLVQCMCLARNPREYQPKYFELLKIIQQAAPSTAVFFMRINEADELAVTTAAVGQQIRAEAGTNRAVAVIETMAGKS